MSSSNATTTTANPYSMTHRTLQDKDGATCVTEIQENDVLLGRGTGPNDHPGNVVFRKLIKDQFSSYGTASVRGDKTKMARQAVAFIHNRNGRFLRRLDPREVSTLMVPERSQECGSSHQGQEVYLVIDDDRLLIQKTKQAFRHLLRQTAQALAASTSASTSTSANQKVVASTSSASATASYAAKVTTPPRTRPIAVMQQLRRARSGSGSVRCKSPETVPSGESGVRLKSVSLASAAIAASVASKRARALSSRNSNIASPTSTASFSAINREVQLLKLVAENDRQIRSQLAKMQLLNLLSQPSLSSPPRTDQRTSLLAALSSGTTVSGYGQQQQQHGASLPAFGYSGMGVADSRIAWNRQRLLSELVAAERAIQTPSLPFR
jgi:hypothetical protein